MKISTRILSLLVLAVTFAASHAQAGRRELQKTSKTSKTATDTGGVVAAAPAGAGVAIPSPVDVSGGAAGAGAVNSKGKGKGSSKGFFDGGVVGGVGGNGGGGKGSKGKGGKGKGAKGKGGKGKGAKGKGTKAKKAKSAKAKKAKSSKAKKAKSAKAKKAKSAKAKKAKSAKAKKAKSSKAKAPTPGGVVTPPTPPAPTPPAPTPPGIETPPPVAPPVSPPVGCNCNVTAEYNTADKSVTLDFDLCGQTGELYDWIGVYKCDAQIVTATEEWWAGILVNPGYIGEPGVPLDTYGFVDGQTYVQDQQLWWTYTCGDPSTGCQTNSQTVWPTSGTVTINPSSPDAPDWQFWGDGTSFSRDLPSGCYKVLLTRELKNAISPPPLPTICPGQPWLNAATFTVP